MYCLCLFWTLPGEALLYIASVTHMTGSRVFINLELQSPVRPTLIFQYGSANTKSC